VDFNGFLYATVRNPATGGQIWRTPLTNALTNGPQPWIEVVSNGFGQGAAVVAEPHHISSGMGSLWVSTLGRDWGSQLAQVWRSSDGVNWIRSSTNGFAPGNNASGRSPVVEVFGNQVVWGGGTLTNPGTGAQVWSMVPQQTLTVNSSHGGAMPSGMVTTAWGTVLSCLVTNSPVTVGGTQYVCWTAAVAGNDGTQVSPTNAMLTLTNDAVLTWQWKTDYWLSPAVNREGTVNVASNWYPAGSTWRSRPPRPTIITSSRGSETRMDATWPVRRSPRP